MSKPVIIIGAGGHAKVLVDALRCSGRAVLGLVDANPTLHGTSVLGAPVMGGDDLMASYSMVDVELANAIGSVESTAARQRIFERFKSYGYTFVRIIHPSATVAGDAVLDEGVQVMAGAVVQVGAAIAKDAIVNTGATVDHDCRIGAHVHLAPGVVLSGGVSVGDGTHIGTGATVVEGARIGAGCLVAAGAVVVGDVAPKMRVAGVPAREMAK